MKKKIGIAIAIIAIVGTFITIGIIKNNSTTKTTMSKGKAYEVEVKTLEGEHIATKAIVNGKVVEVNKKNMAFKSAYVVKEVLVEKGDQVKKGQQLLIIDTASMEKELQQLILNKQSKELTIKKANNTHNTSSSKSLEVAVELATLDLENAVIVHKNEVENYEKNKALFESGIISKSELDASKKKVDDAAKEVTSSELRLEKSKTDLSSLQSSNAKNKNNNEIEAEIQRKSLEGIMLSIKTLEEKMEEANQATLAPVDGVVTTLDAEEGIAVKTLEPVITIVDMDDLKVTVDIKENDIKNVEIGQFVTIKGKAISNVDVVEGKISFIDSIAKSKSSSGRETTVVEADITLTKGKSILKPGYTTECEIKTKEKKDALVVSYDMIKEDEQRKKYVFVVDENNTLVKQSIVLGMKADFNVEVIEGLSIGDRVVINPSPLLKEGKPVIIKEKEEAEESDKAEE